MYEKDADGRVKIDVGGTVTPVAHGEAGAGLRNHSSRVFLKDGDTFEVVAFVNGSRYATLTNGTAKAKTGKMCSIYVRTRAEADVVEPVEHVEEPG